MNYIGITRMRLDDTDFLDYLASALRVTKAKPGEASPNSSRPGREEARSFLLAHFPQMAQKLGSNGTGAHEA
jgi:hypothetical protein